MSMSTYVYGIRPPDEEWRNKVKAWEACKAAGVSPPEELEDYFDELECLPPDQEKGPKVSLEKHSCCKEYRGDGEEGFDVEISKMPPGLTHIRFVNNW